VYMCYVVCPFTSQLLLVLIVPAHEGMARLVLTWWLVNAAMIRVATYSYPMM